MTNASTGSASKAYKGQTDADTKNLRIYEVTFHSTEHSVAKLKFKARSAAEAEEAANDSLFKIGIDDWKPAYDEIGVESVKVMGKAEDNE